MAEVVFLSNTNIQIASGSSTGSGVKVSKLFSAPLPDAVLPPFSAGFCDALCRLPEGKTQIRPDLLSFERSENHAVRVILTLTGSFTVRMIREYAEEEIIHLYSHDIPTLAVWPNLPFVQEDWHAYFIYASLPSSVSINVLNAAGESLASEDGSERNVIRSGSFPLSFSFSQDGKSIGSLPNLLPSPVIDKHDTFTACVDFGSVGTSVVFAVGHQRRPMQGPTLVRTLINNPAVSRDLLRKEFLPAVPVSALLPTASRLFRNVPGASPLPFEDGIVLMSSDLQDVLSIPSGALYTCLKWEEEKGRSVNLCLHQIMLMAALQARSDGASSLLWRFSVPDEMAKEGRERLTALFSALAEAVCMEQSAGKAVLIFPTNSLLLHLQLKARHSELISASVLQKIPAAVLWFWISAPVLLIYPSSFAAVSRRSVPARSRLASIICSCLPCFAIPVYCSVIWALLRIPLSAGI